MSTPKTHTKQASPAATSSEPHTGSSLPSSPTPISPTSQAYHPKASHVHSPAAPAGSRNASPQPPGSCTR